MGVHADHWIRERVEQDRMIEPFAPELVRDGKISYGCSSYGYDMRLASEFWVPQQHTLKEIDPKNLPDSAFQKISTNVYLLPPHQFVIGRSVEYFRIPRNVLTICFGKSTYARSGLLVNITPFEPEWEGYVTFPIFNTTPFPAKIYANEGIAQVIFLEAAEMCKVSYADRKGKYQKQAEITLAKV